MTQPNETPVNDATTTNANTVTYRADAPGQNGTMPPRQPASHRRQESNHPILSAIGNRAKQSVNGDEGSIFWAIKQFGIFLRGLADAISERLAISNAESAVRRQERDESEQSNRVTVDELNRRNQR